jgi:hypothetical protein
MRNAILVCSAIGLAACGLDQQGTGPSEPPTAQGTPSASDPPSASDAAGQGDPSTPTNPAPDAASACPMLAGTWTGQLDGTITGDVQGTVTGTARMLFVAGAAPEEYPLQDGSQLALNVDVDGTSEPVTQTIAGSAKCGVLDSAQDSQVLGVDVHLILKCTFSGSGCSGTWTSVAKDGSATAHGTFTVAKH